MLILESANIPQCNIGDTRCIKDTTNVVLARFHEGIDFNNILKILFLNNIFKKIFLIYFSGEPKVALSSFDPLRIQRMNIKQGGNSPVNIELIFTNVELLGLRDFVCTSVK